MKTSEIASLFASIRDELRELKKHLADAGLPVLAILSEHEAAKVAKVSVKTIRRLILAGRLAATDYGTGGRRRLYRIHPDALRNVDEPTEAAPAPKALMRASRAARQRTDHSIYPRVA